MEKDHLNCLIRGVKMSVRNKKTVNFKAKYIIIHSDRKKIRFC